VFNEPLGDPVHLGLRAEPAVGNHGRSLLLNQCDDDLAMTSQHRVRPPDASPSNLPSLAPRQSLPRMNDLCLDQGGAPSTGVFGDTT
jgi:hypothetical protein